MEYLQGIYRISHVGTGSMCDFTIECPQLAQRSKAGQFVHIRLPGFTLRRPISICEAKKPLPSGPITSRETPST